MSLMKRALEGSTPAAESTAPKSAWQTYCLADGCPLYGTIGHGSSWKCRFHYGEAAHEWPRITGELQQHRLRSTGPFTPEPPNPYLGWSVEQCRAEINRLARLRRDEPMREKAVRINRAIIADPASVSAARLANARDSLSWGAETEDDREARLEREAIVAQ